MKKGLVPVFMKTTLVAKIAEIKKIKSSYFYFVVLCQLGTYLPTVAVFIFENSECPMSPEVCTSELIILRADVQ